MATTITEKDVLNYYGFTKPPYSAQHVSTEFSTTKHSQDPNKYDTDEWIIYKDGKPISKSKYERGASFNACAIKGDRGIIIVDKKKFKSEAKNSAGAASSQLTSTGASTDYNTDPYLSMVSETPMMAGWIEAVDYSPKEHDEKIIKNIQFAKVSLLKECYEWVGLNLSLNEPIENIDNYIHYWQ